MDYAQQVWTTLSGLPEWVRITGILALAGLGGWGAEKVLVRGLRRRRDRGAAPEAIGKALRGLPGIWFLTGAGYVIVATMGLVEPWPSRARTGLVIVLIVTLVVFSLRFASTAIRAATRRAGSRIPSTIITNVVRLLVLILGGGIILQNLGVNISTLVATVGITGLAVALALQDTLGNLFAGIQIIMSRQINPGDFVHLATGEEGRVTDVQVRNTTIQTYPERNRILVPNAIMAATIVTNYSLPEEKLLIRLPVGVAYDSDLEKVERVTLDVACEVLRDIEGGLTDEMPVLRYRAFSDFSIDFLLRVPIRQFTDQFEIRHVLIKRIHERFATEGIEIPFPIRTVVFRDRPGGPMADLRSDSPAVDDRGGPE